MSDDLWNAYSSYINFQDRLHSILHNAKEKEKQGERTDWQGDFIIHMAMENIWKIEEYSPWLDGSVTAVLTCDKMLTNKIIEESRRALGLEEKTEMPPTDIEHMEYLQVMGHHKPKR